MFKIRAIDYIKHDIDAFFYKFFGNPLLSPFKKKTQFNTFNLSELSNTVFQQGFPN